MNGGGEVSNSGVVVGMRAGAAAFVLGLSLAGQQVAGVAAADSGPSDDQSISADSSANEVNRTVGPRGSTAVRSPAKSGRVASRQDTSSAQGGAGVASRGTGKQELGKQDIARSNPARAALRLAAAATTAPPTAAALLDNGAQAFPHRRSVGAAAPSAASAVAKVWRGLPVADGVTMGVPDRTAAVSEPLSTQVRTASETFFNRLANVLIDLPANNVTSYLEGALLMVRKTFFNYGPQIAPSTPYMSGDGNIKGRLGGFDLEGDSLTYRVVEAPSFGTVSLGADGGYVYTPGLQYGGTDAFTVEVASARPPLAINLLAPLANNVSRLVEVQVGVPLPAAPFDGSGQSQQSRNDVALYLPDASGHITVRKSPLGNLFTATVTLADTPSDTPVKWMDSTGDLGEVSLDGVMKLWPALQAKAIHSGASMDMGVIFTADDNTEHALLMSEVSMSRNTNGQYVLTGRLTPDTEARPDSVDRWDVVGLGLKAQYENFRTTYGIDNQMGLAPAEIDFRSAAVFADTASPVSYEQYGLYAFDHQQAADSGGAAEPAPSLTSAVPVPENATSEVSASIPLGQSFVIGRRDGTVELWTNDVKQVLQAPIALGGVRQILEYDRPLQDAGGKFIAGNFTGSIKGDVLTVTAMGAGSEVVVGQEITGAGVAPGTYITEFIAPETARCTEKSSSGDCTKSVGGQGGTDGGAGTYKVSKAQTVASTVITQPTTLAKAPGFVVSLDDGRIRLWSATDGWIELHGVGESFRPESIVTYGEGIAVGTINGEVWKWDGPTAQAPSAWKNNWRKLLPSSSTDSGPTVNLVVVPKSGDDSCYGANCDYGIVAVRQVTNTQTALTLIPSAGGPAQRMSDLPGLASAGGLGIPVTPYANGVAVGYKNGSVVYWDLRHPNAAPSLLRQSNGQPVTAMLPYQVPGSNDLKLVIAQGENAALSMYTGQPDSGNGKWISLQNPSWTTGVTHMMTFDSAAISKTPGVVVTLGDGSVQLWYGDVDGAVANQRSNTWVTLHNTNWLGRATTVIPFDQNLPDTNGNVVARDGIVVGMDTGSVQKWSGLISGGTGQNEWTQLVCRTDGCNPAPGPQPITVSQETLKAAVQFAKDVNESGAQWMGNIGGSQDPLFHNGNLRAACETNRSCDGQYLPISMVVNMSPLKKEWKASEGDELGASVGVDASLTLSYDVNGIAYGYAFMPNGFFTKLVPGKWSMAMLAAVETGPALTVNLGEEGAVISAPRSNLLNWDFSTPGPLLIDRFALGMGVDGEFGVGVVCGDAACPDKLQTHAYLVPGMLFAYNTQNNPKSVGLASNWYPDLDYSDFGKVTGGSLTATLTPYTTMNYGIFAPDSWFLIGGWSLFTVGMGYENPLSATVAVAVDAPPSMTIGAEGYFTTHAGILEMLTSKLSWDNSIQLYDVKHTYTL